MQFPFPFTVISGNNNVSFPFPKFGKRISIPVPKNWEWNFHSRSHSQKLGMQFYIPIPVPEIRECNFPFPFPLPGMAYHVGNRVGMEFKILHSHGCPEDIYHHKWKLGQQIPWLLWQKLFTLWWSTPTLQFSPSPTPLCHNICSNRNNIIKVIHGNSRNALNSSNNFHIVRVYPRAYKIFEQICCGICEQLQCKII